MTCGGSLPSAFGESPFGWPPQIAATDRMTVTRQTKTRKVERATNQRAARIAEAVRLRRDFGMDNRAIAIRLGISERTVSRYFAQSMAQWRAQLPDDVEAARRQIFARLENIADEARKEYERSKQPRIETTIEREAVPGKPQDEWPITKVVTKRTERVGDKGLLKLEMETLVEGARLFGLHKEVAKHLEVTGEAQMASIFATLQYVQQQTRPENLPTVISADGRVMVRDADGVPQLPPLGGNGEPIDVEVSSGDQDNGQPADDGDIGDT